MILNSPTISGSLTVTGNIVASGSITLSGSVASASYALSASNAATASSADNFLTRGTLTAQTLVVQTVTSSVIYSSGSNVFGNNIANTQIMTGSVTVTGSLAVVTNGTEFQVTNTGVRIGNVIGDAHSITGSVGISGSLSGSSANFSGTITTNTSTAADNNLRVQNSTNAYASAINLIANNDDGARYNYINSSTNGGNTHWQIGGGSVANTMIFYTNNNAERMRISSGGNISIGTTNTSARLNVQASANFENATLGTATGTMGYLAANGLYGMYIGIGNSGNTWLQSQRNDGGTDVYNLLLNPRGGNVGIGTSSPTTTLTVKSSNDNGYALTRPSNDTVEHWKLSTTETGGDAYTVAYNTFNCDQIFTTYAGGGTGGNIILRTGGTSGTITERMRITSGGNIVTQTFINLTDVVSQTDSVDAWPILSFSGANGVGGITRSAGTYDWGIIKGGTSRGYYGRVVGAIHASSTIDQGFFTSGWTTQFIVNGSNGNAFLRGTLTQGSDARIKTNIADLNHGLDEVMQLRAVSYNKKIFNRDNDGNILSEGVDTTNNYIGFIAQEVKLIIPEVVNGDENSENPEHGLSIEYQNITALLVKAIQELKATNDNLQSRIETLESK
jgi:hypothetical protein